MTDIHGNRFEYVASGLNYTRMTYDPTLLDADPKLKQFITDAFVKAQTIGANHAFSVLFNGWTEVAIGELLQRFRSDVPNLYADSGGLQVYTQGKKITEDLKVDVYRTQAKFATRGFIFDEQPIASATSGNLSKHNMGGRWFSHDLVEPQGRLTGQNVKRQIETFLETDTPARVMLILHGNCLESYQRCLDYILDEVPEDMHHMIHGIGLGGGALGGGALEDVKRIFYFSQLESPLNIDHVHILGIGSVRRNLPPIIFAQSGLFKNLLISYDSTTHTSGLTQGRHWMDIKRNELHISKRKNHVWETMWENVNSHFDLSDLSFDEYYDYCLESSYERIKAKYENGSNHIRCYFATAMSGIFNFIQWMEKFIQDENFVHSYLMGNHKLRHLSYLKDVKDMRDFHHWERNHGKYLPSKPVTMKPTTLEDFFNEE